MIPEATGPPGKDELGPTPLVSIIMATYNSIDTLPQALKSIEDQTYTNWELIACDDASTDMTRDVLENFARRHEGKVTLIRNDVNRRLAYSLNRCLEHASGPLVARMDADDLSAPERLSRQVEFLRSRPDIDLIGTAMQRFNNSGQTEVIRLEPWPDRSSLRGDVPFAHATVMLYKRVYDALGGYTVSPRTVRGQDKDLWFRFYHQGYTGANLPDPLYLVREDVSALRRRTFRVRWNSYRTSLIGFRLLGYPKAWYVGPTVALLKGVVPAALVMRYRQIRARLHTVTSSDGQSG